MSKKILPMDIGEIFNTTVTMFGKTFVRNLILAVIFLIIPIVLLTLVGDDFFTSLGEITKQKELGREIDSETMYSFLEALSFGGFIFSVFMLAYFFAEIAITIVVGGEILGEDISFISAVSQMFNKVWLRCMGEALLKIIAYTIGGIVFGILIAFG